MMLMTGHVRREWERTEEERGREERERERGVVGEMRLDMSLL